MIKSIESKDKESKQRFHELIKTFENVLFKERILEIAKETGVLVSCFLERQFGVINI